MGETQEWAVYPTRGTLYTAIDKQVKTKHKEFDIHVHMNVFCILISIFCYRVDTTMARNTHQILIQEENKTGQKGKLGLIVKPHQK